MESVNLGIPVLNRGDVLQRLLKSIDVPANVLLVINKIGLLDASVAETLRTINEHFTSKVKVFIHRVEGNLGVAGSWNKIIDFFSGNCLICNSDIEFSSGFLSEAMACVEKKADIVMHHLCAAACFYVTEEFTKKLGWFDENIWPAYHEDQEMALRASVLNIPRNIIHDVKGTVLHHGSVTRSSATKVVRRFIGRAQVVNGKYLHHRWGEIPAIGEKVNKPLPFNELSLHPSDWQLNLKRRQRLAKMCERLTGLNTPIIFHRTSGGLCS